MTKKKAKSLAAKARKLLRARDAGREKYAESDRLLRQMRDAGMKPGDAVVINAAGDKVLLDDNFAASDKVFRAHGISRYELRIEKAKA
jgi:hypothetical protein